MNTGAKPAIGNQLELARSFSRAGRYQEALDALTAPGENVADFYTLRGDLQFQLKRFEEAAGSYFTSATVEAPPRNAYAQYRLGVCLYELRRWLEAAQSFQKVLDLHPHRDDVRLSLGACLLHMDRPEEALAHFDRCRPDAANQRALFGRAVALQMLGRRNEAEAAYRRLLASDPKSEEALTNLIALYAEARDLENIRRCASRLLEVSPESVSALQGLAAAALARHEYESAFRYCSRIVERAPDCVEAWHNLRFASGRVVSTLRASPPAENSTLGRK